MFSWNHNFALSNSEYLKPLFWKPCVFRVPSPFLPQTLLVLTSEWNVKTETQPRLVCRCVGLVEDSLCACCSSAEEQRCWTDSSSTQESTTKSGTPFFPSLNPQCRPLLDGLHMSTLCRNVLDKRCGTLGGEMMEPESYLCKGWWANWLCIGV